MTEQTEQATPRARYVDRTAIKLAIGNARRASRRQKKETKKEKSERRARAFTVVIWKPLYRVARDV